MLNVNSINFKDLETRGFLVIPKFIDNETIAQIKNHYIQASNLKLRNNNYAIIASDQQAISSEYLDPILKTISQTTNIKVNRIMSGTTYFDNQNINFEWHQDHEPYYMWQDSYNAINCWIPVIKPSAHQSGISIIPHDKLQNAIPDIFEKNIVKQGAKVLIKQLDGTSIIRDDHTGEIKKLSVDLSELAESPNLAEGDMIILRQDIFHKTQDTDTKRVAISIRCVNKDTVLIKNHFLTRCEKKETMIKNNSKSYDLLIQKFVVEGLENIKISDI